MVTQELRQSIYDQFIKQYIDRFSKEIIQIPYSVHVAKALYLFAYTDYFGKISYVADTGDTSKIGSARNNFTYLLKNYFPADYKGREDEIYELYRCGIMHAVYPKSAGLNYFVNGQTVTFKEEVGIPSQKYQIDVLNLWKYEQDLQNVITSFGQNILLGKADNHVANMQMLLTNDIFGDATAYKKYYP